MLENECKSSSPSIICSLARMTKIRDASRAAHGYGTGVILAMYEVSTRVMCKKPFLENGTLVYSCGSMYTQLSLSFCTRIT
jgi:hypothetical protein